MSPTNRFSALTPGTSLGEPDAPAYSLPTIGKVRSVAAAGVTFTLPGIAEYFGPAPWSIGSSDDAADAITDGNAPQVGDTCLVVFAADHEPWIVGWTR